MADSDIVLSKPPKGLNRFFQGLIDPKGVKEKDEVDKMRKLSKSDLEIFSRGVPDEDLHKLSKNGLEYFIETEESKDIDPFEVTDPSAWLEAITKAPILEKGVETAVDMGVRGFGAMTERAVESGKLGREGLKEFAGAEPIGPEGSVDIAKPLLGLGKAGLGALGITTSPGAGIAEAVVPPTVKQRDWWKLGVELAVPVVPGGVLTKFGKPSKLLIDKKLVEMLGGKITDGEKKIIETYHKWAAKTDNIVDNEVLATVIRLKRESRAKQVGKPVTDATVDGADFAPEWASRLGISGEQMTKMIAEGDAHLLDMMKAGADLLDAGIGKRGFFVESLGLTSGLKNSERGFKRKFLDIWASFRASMMTSGVMTSNRNAEVTAQFFLVDALDRGLQGILKASINRKTITSKELGASLMYMADLLKTLNPISLYKGTANKMNQIMRAHAPTLARTMAFKRRTYDSTVIGAEIPTRIAAFASVLNNTQEYFFRRIAMEASLRNQLRAVGKKFEDVHPSEIPEEMMETAIESGFRMTMAKGPPHLVDPVTQRVNQHMIERLTDNGFFKLFIMPFPRFVFRNMIPFIRDFSPFGYLNAIKPSTVKKMMQGDPTEFTKYASRAMIGSTFTGFAMGVRGSDQLSTYTSPSGKVVRSKYFEWVRQDAKGDYYTIDLRVISPTVGPYLYLAEAFLHPDNITASDLGELAFGLRRSGALLLDTTGLFTDSYDPDADKHFYLSLGKMVGEFAGSFMPRIIDSLVDIAAGLNVAPPEWSHGRSDRIDITEDNQQNFTQQALATWIKNIPILRNKLPLRYDPVDLEKGGVYDITGIIPGPFSESTNVLAKHFTGLRVEKKHPLRTEFDALRLKGNYGGSMTGVGPVDNMVNFFMASEMNAKGGLLDKIKSPEYRKMKSEDAQTNFIRKQIYGNPPSKPDGIYRRALLKVFLGLASEAKEGNYGALDLLMKASMKPYAPHINDPQKRRDIIGALGEKGIDLPKNMRPQSFLSELVKGGVPSGSNSLNFKDLTENIVKGGR